RALALAALELAQRDGAAHVRAILVPQARLVVGAAPLALDAQVVAEEDHVLPRRPHADAQREGRREHGGRAGHQLTARGSTGAASGGATAPNLAASSGERLI